MIRNSHKYSYNNLLRICDKLSGIYVGLNEREAILFILIISAFGFYDSEKSCEELEP